METIMYTNSKREAASYEVDRIVLSERLEVGQLLENEMEKYNIRHIHFWFAADNLALLPDHAPHALLAALARHLHPAHNAPFTFQYHVEKYRQDAPEAPLQREEVLAEQLRFAHFREFECFAREELGGSAEQEVLKKCLFETQEQTVAVSFFHSAQKQLVLRLIEEDCRQAIEAKLHFRKISALHPEDFEKHRKKPPQPLQLHHRLLLFLYAPEELRDSKRRKGGKAGAAWAEALEGWRAEAAESVGRYERECELIKQEMEKEKLVFRNKMKVIENYIGDSINVEKLYQEEEEVAAQPLPQPPTLAPFKKPPLLAKRSSVTPAITQAVSSNLSKYNSLTNPFPLSEFKRLKDISEAMRNIDNTISEQHRKIEQLRGRAKELRKTKEEVLFRNAKELNALKQEILTLSQEIQRKQEEIQEKQLNGHFQTLLQYKGKEPSEAARQNLEQHIKFISMHHQPKEPQHQQQEGREEERTNRSLHRKENQPTHSALAKYREKKAQESKATAARLKAGGGEEAMKGSKLSHFLKEDDSETASSLANLIELYRYFIRNQQLVSLVTKETDSYHLINRAPPTHSALPAPLDLKDFPVLQGALQLESLDLEYEPTAKQNLATQYKMDSSMPRDCFQYFMRGQGKGSRKESVRSSMREEMDRCTQSVIVAKPEPMMKHNSQIWPKPSKFKRITIEEALSSNSLLKKVRMQE